MALVVRKMAKYGGTCLASAFAAGKFLGPLIGQLQKIKTEEIITNESIIRRFEQSLIEGESKFVEESGYISEMIKCFFNIEGLTERLRTCRQEDKRDIWNEVKALVFARLMTSVYLNYSVLIISKVEMILIAKHLIQYSNSSVKDDSAFEKCRAFMDEVKGFYSILVAEICPIMIEVCKNVLEFTNLDHKIENNDAIQTILMQLKRRADVSFSICHIMDKYYSKQIDPSQPSSELLLYCKSHNFHELLDYMICDGVEEIVLNGLYYTDDNKKSRILLSWITYFCTIFNSEEENSINDIMIKKWSGENLVFSHMAILFCENLN